MREKEGREELGFLLALLGVIIVVSSRGAVSGFEEVGRGLFYGLVFTCLFF